MQEPGEAQRTRPAAPTRREAMRMAGLGFVAASLAGCDLLSTNPSQQSKQRGRAVGKPKEAPDLAADIKRGDLPPLSKRLPAKPMVVTPLRENGRYGGQLKLLGLHETVDVNATIGYENLVRWKPGIQTDLTGDQVIPNVAKSVESSADGTEYTVSLREGMRWSDGEPFGAADIMFWYESVASNKKLTPIPIDWLVTGEEPFVVEKVDEHTVMFRFPRPNGLFMVNLATQRGTPVTDFPAHYMKQFHADHAADIDKVVKASDKETWIDLFWAKANRAENPERPVIDAWQLTAAISDSRRPVAKRNPYYWKTDPDGSQLPYVDSVSFELVHDDETAVLKMTNGDFHLIDTGINQLRNKPVFARSRKQAGYDFFETIPQQMNQMIVMVNLTHHDHVLRTIFRDKRFRIGLSHAINRQEIIKSVFQRQGEPWQAAPRPESPFYNEKLAKQYTDHNPELAKSYLDKVLPDKDASGFRLRPDGKKLFFQVEVTTSQPDLSDALQLVRAHWREVGIDMAIKSEDDELFFERMDANAHDACVWIGGGGLGATMDPFYYMPYNFNTRYAMPWYFWYNNPKDNRAEEPPPEAVRQVDMYRQLLSNGDEQQRQDLMKQILAIAVEQFYCIGIALRKREYGIVANQLHNTPDVSVTGWLHANLMPNDPQQYFLAT